MPVGGFSRPVVVRESSARHCFLSLPRTLTSLILPVQTPTFSLVDTDGRRLLLSWAGEVHNSPASDVEEHEEVFVGREVLRGNGMSDGDFGVLTQVPVPPQCSSVCVVVSSLDEWEVLALNAEVAQLAFLNQVRVLGLGQCIPLWLEGGAYVTLKVTALEPPAPHLTLQPMSQVEVLPPSEDNQSPSHAAINFSASQLSSESPLDYKSEEDYNKEEKSEEKEEGDPKDILTQIFKFMVRELKDWRASQSDFPTRKDVCLGARVVGVPEGVLNCLEKLTFHPSLVIINRDSVSGTVYSDRVSFVAGLRLIKSPKDLADGQGVREEKNPNTGEKKQEKSSSEPLCSFVCTVVVWENYLTEKTISGEQVCEISAALKGRNCIVPGGLRRLMKLSNHSIIELQTVDIVTKTVPVRVDMFAITGGSDASLVQKIKTTVKDLTDECPVIINKNTLLEVRLDDGRVADVLVGTRDGQPLQLTRKSSVLLDVTLLNEHPDIPHILSSTCDLRTNFHVRYPYIGDQEALSKLREHILFALDTWSSAGPHFALLQGSKGSGKTSLMESLMESLQGHPHHMHCDMTSLKLLKGKKAETVEKRLQLVFREAIFHRPSVVFLDDLDNLAPSVASEDQAEAGLVHNHSMQVVAVLKLLLEQLMEYLESPTCEEKKCGGVVVVASCLGRTAIHSLLVNPQGCHYFPCTFSIPPLGSEGRVAAFSAMLSPHITRHVGAEGVKTSPQTATPQGTDTPAPVVPKAVAHHLEFDNKFLAKRTESFTLPDLYHLALRTYLKACDSWKGNEGILGVSAGDFQKSPGQELSRKEVKVVNGDLEDALEGYTPLALRGLSLSEKGGRTGRQGVGGLGEARAVLEETLTWPAAHPALFSKVRLRLRSGVLLYGPPGSGKTLLAHSVAADCHLNFIAVKGPELLSKYIGASEEAVRDAFERASSAKPCVLFFDEFESIAPRRGHDSTGVTDRVVNQLLTQMDGVEGLSGVYVLAATSRPDLIDPALLRPGRLDKCVFCPMPTLSDRQEILEVLSQDMELGEVIDWSEVASLTEHFTGADLQGLLSSAQVLVGQEALGDSLYEGVIPNEQMRDARESDAEGDSDLGEENDLMEAERDYCIQREGELVSAGSAESLGSCEEVVLEEKGQKVLYKERGVATSPRNTREKSVVSRDVEASPDSKINEELERLPQESESKAGVPHFKVYRRHILAALREVRPSVTPNERRKYEQLYRSFSKSREGSFGQPSPGKRATLA